MIVSQIQLRVNSIGHYSVKIKHDGKVVVSLWHKNADAAYRDAELRLIYKPGYVQSVEV